MNLKNLYLFVAKSGTGKTAVTRELCRRFKLKDVKSVTTRGRRTPDEDGYYFLTDEEYDKANLVQHAVFSGCRYGATMEELDSSQLFVVCPDGITELLDTYVNKPMVIIHLVATEEVRRQRMLSRGDSEENVEVRIKHDAEHFGTLPDLPTFHINAMQPFDDVIEEVGHAMWLAENVPIHEFR